MPGQLLRETNPAQGYGPALVPQHEDVNGDYKRTGEVNPLPVSIEDGGAAVQVDLQYHAIAGTNAIPVKGYAAQVPAQSGVAIRDTVLNEILVDVSALTGEKLIVLTTTLNQSVNLYVYAEGPGYTYASVGTRNGIASGATVISSTDFGALRGPIQKLRIRVQATTAPTAGTISIFVEGVQA
jgi:hypothetical protein